MGLAGRAGDASKLTVQRASVMNCRRPAAANTRPGDGGR